MYTVNWCPWSKIINESFIPLVENRDRYLIMWGGRGSSKSDFAAKKLIYRCLTEPYFRFILIRNNYNSIKDSSYQTIKDIVIDLGLAELFEFKLQPLEIICKNGNKFIARGCDDTTKLKSVKDPTGAWYEEDIPNESDFITITTSIRTGKAAYLQEVFTINPEVEGNYEDHWFWKKFFRDKPHFSFRDTTEIEFDGNVVGMSYTSHHSTYKDNRWIPNDFVAFLHSMRRDNPYYYTIYCLGHWGNRESGGQFYKNFKRAFHVEPLAYNPDLPLHISFDFNVNPYMTCTVWQIDGKDARQIDEICLKSPNNTTSAVCMEFVRRYGSHKAGLFIYGDPSGRQEDTRSEKGYNDYKIIEQCLASLRPHRRVALKAPPVVMRGNFINTVLESNFAGIHIRVHEQCINTINDYSYLKQASDGTKHKEKVKDHGTGVSYEKYGHCSDANDYFLCEAFSSEFEEYQTGGKRPKPILGRKAYRPEKIY